MLTLTPDGLTEDQLRQYQAGLRRLRQNAPAVFPTVPGYGERGPDDNWPTRQVTFEHDAVGNDFVELIGAREPEHLLRAADHLTRSYTAFKSFEDFLNTPMRRPSLKVTRSIELTFLADAYDLFQLVRQDGREIYRY